MFNSDFWPSPVEVIERMLEAYSIENKVVLEGSAGKGDIVDQLKLHGAKDVIACEINADLRKILSTKCRVIANDFLTVTSDIISHVDFIVINPPFSADEKHILYAFDIAPAGCTILSLANLNTVKSCYTESRKRLRSIIEQNGSYEDWGSCFSTAERKTDVNIAFIKLQKPGDNYNNEFDGFYLEDEPEEAGENGLMSYNFVRDLVNRYIGAVKIYDEQLNAAVKMNQLTSGFYSTKMAMTMTEESKPVSRNEFKKEMQKAGWSFIFQKMNMQKYATKGLKEDINKFVEKQTNIPFTMKNIYKMLEIVIGTAAARMDRAILEVFDKLTQHTHDNRYCIEGFKTNSHYLMNQKFIMPGLCYQDRWNKDSSKINTSSYGDDTISDFIKALCFISGTNYDTIGSFYNGTRSYNYGEKFEYAFFYVRCYKKGSAHFEFKDLELWGKFNQHVSRLKGYPLFEFKTRTAWQKRQNKAA